MSVPKVVLEDMARNFPFGRKPSKLRERSKYVRSKKVRELLRALAEGAKTVRIDKDLEELAKGNEEDKALLLIALYFPVVVASKNPEDPTAAAILVNSRIYLTLAGLDEAAKNVGEILKQLGRRLIAAIAEISDPEYARSAARAALAIGKATGDEFLKAFGIELLKALGEEVDEDYELSPEEEFELRATLAASFLSLGMFDRVISVLEGVEDERAYFVKALAALFLDDVETRGVNVAKLKELDTPEARFLLTLLEAVKCAYKGDEKCYEENLKKAKELLSEVPELHGILQFVENLRR